MQTIDKNKKFPAESLGFATGVIAVALSMGVCSGIGPAVGALGALFVLLASDPDLRLPMMPVYMGFSTVSYAYAVGGTVACSAAVCFSGLLLAACAPFAEKLRRFISPACTAGLMLAGALTVTVMQTNDYFAIGGEGNMIRDMLASYVSKGFHPNWRGVLYGTITMVILITFPRKFKKASLTVRPAFLALVFTLLLNLWLNPSYMPTSIKEIGAIGRPQLLTFDAIGAAGSKALITGLICGAALWLQLLYLRLSDKDSERSDLVFGGVFNILISLLPGAFLPTKPVKKFKATAAALCFGAIMLALLFIPLAPYSARIPTASCAVVLIVGAWQSVKWGKLRAAFASPLTIVLFALSLLITLLTDIAVGTIVSAVIGAVFAGVKDSAARRSAAA